MDWILDFYNYRVVVQYLPEFVRGLGATAWISLVALVLALTIGTIVAVMRMSHNPILWRVAAGYVQTIRSTPLLIQIYLIYFTLPALPLLDRRLDELEGGIIALGLNAGAFMSEIIRAGIVPATYALCGFTTGICQSSAAFAGADRGTDQGQFTG